MPPRTRTSESGRDSNVEKILLEHLPNGEESFRYVERFPLSEIERNPESQSRLSTVDRAYVRQLAESMKAGTLFPPVILWETPDNGTVLIDGNHRAAAGQRRSVTHLPAYVVHLSGQPEAVYLSAVFNGGHGKRLTTEELRRAIVEAGKIKPEPSNARLAKDYGVSAAQIGRIRTEHQTARRLDALAVAASDSLTQGQLLPLAKLPMDNPVKAAAELIIDAQMQPADVRELVKELTELSSEDGQLQRVARERIARQEDIKAVKAGRKSSGSPVVDMRRCVGQIEKLIEIYPNMEAWLPADPAVISQWYARIDKVAGFLAKVAESYGTHRPDDDTEASAA
jgi:ParB-like chromosome segregation protein Spo0J